MRLFVITRENSDYTSVKWHDGVKLSNDYQFSSALLFITIYNITNTPNTDTIPIPIRYQYLFIYQYHYCCVCEIVQRFTLALPFVTFQYCPSWSCQIHEDIWKIFGHRSVIECFQPFGPPRHQLMYTYYQFVPPRCKWLYNDTAPHTANHTGHIQQTIQTVRGNIRQRGNQCDIAGDKIVDYPRSSIITTAYHIAICTRCGLIIESADTPSPVETLQIESKCLIVKFSSKLLDLSKGDISCTVSVSHQLIKS